MPLVPLLLLAAAGITLATPKNGAGVELVSAAPSGHSGNTDMGKPDSTRATAGRVVPFLGPAESPVIAFESVAKDLMSGNTDVNGMADVYLFDTGQHKVVDLLSVATNGKAGCAGTPAWWDPLESTCRHASLSIL